MDSWKSNIYLYSKLTNFMIENKIKYGANIRKICKEKSWKLISYPTERFLECMRISEDGFSVYKNNEYYVFYNPFQTPERINFTLAHEVAHIALYHHILNKKTIMAKGSPSIAEQQANIFAHNILMPISITIEQSKIKNIYELSEQFEVSPSMVKTRLFKLENDLKWFKKIFEERKI